MTCNDIHWLIMDMIILALTSAMLLTITATGYVSLLYYLYLCWLYTFTTPPSRCRSDTSPPLYHTYTMPPPLSTTPPSCCQSDIPPVDLHHTSNYWMQRHINGLGYVITQS